MADTCYYKGTKVILLSHQNSRGKWACQLTIPDLKTPAIEPCEEGHPPKEYDTEQEAETAAFERSKKILDSSYRDITGDRSH